MPRQKEGETAGQHVDSRAADNLIGFETDAGERVKEGKQTTCRRPGQQSVPEGATFQERLAQADGQGAGKGACYHQSFQTDVDDAAALTVQTAQSRDHKRNRIGHSIRGDLFYHGPHEPTPLTLALIAARPCRISKLAAAK